MGSFSDGGNTLKQVERMHLYGSEPKVKDRTRIDDHAKLALICGVLGLVPLALYWIAFKAFRSSSLPWKIALAVELICPTVIYAHYLLNRRARRLYWEGVAALFGVVPIWMIIGSHWLFYFGFAPMPAGIRAAALLFCIGVTVISVMVTWKNYRRATEQSGLLRRMLVVEPDKIVFPDTLDRGVSMFQRSWRWMPTPPIWVISLVGSVGTAYAAFVGRLYEAPGGPHILFMMLSVIGFPFSCLIIGHFFVRLAYFHIYLPLKLERETGKRVILGQ
ncbi:hypothetical protein [Burkholderia territorii]|uniref:hypothetical protein n=1 Tax=Burkholderia territorii TaxID=1503055 RepID=UPI001E394854|nr:hypothetical protein [Burkholderia territorii]